jgi:hypothetical protein
MVKVWQNWPEAFAPQWLTVSSSKKPGLLVIMPFRALLRPFRGGLAVYLTFSRQNRHTAFFPSLQADGPGNPDYA